MLEGLPVAPWCRPKERRIAPGVYVTNEYAHHYIAALLYALWRKVTNA
jgi:hypothetical protein